MIRSNNSSPRVLRRLSCLLGLLVMVATVAIFHPVLRADFVAWDDDHHIYANPRLQPPTWSHVGAFWRAPYLDLYIPVTYTVWAGLVWLTQALHALPSASLFHLANLLCHLGSTLVVYRILIMALSPGQAATSHTVGAAAAGAMLFAGHPLQVEAVAWVSGLKDVLSGWWAIVALWQYMLYVRTPASPWRWGYYGLATLAFTLALLAKPAAVVVPIMAWLLATARFGQSRQQATRALLGWLVLAVGWSILTKTQQPDGGMSAISPVWGRPIIAADALAFYLGRLLWPLHLGADYGRTPHLVLGQVGAYFSSLLLLGLGLFWCWKPRCLRTLWFTMAVFTVGLLPVLGWVPFFFQGYSTVADRYVYLAFVGPVLGLSWGLYRLRTHRLVWGAVYGCIGVFAWLSAGQVQVWQNTMTLFTHTLQVNPRSALAHEKIATVLAQQQHYTEALTYYVRALQLRPNSPTVYNNLGVLYAQQGDLQEARRYYAEATRLHPHNAQFHTNLGSVLAAQGDLDAAITQYTDALRLNPHIAQTYYNLGNTLVRQGKREAALEHYTTALRLRPAWAEAHNNLGSTLDDLGRSTEAIAQYQEALRLNPDFAEAYNNLGDACLDQGRVAEAVAAFQAAVRLKPAWAEASYNLGGALVRHGRWQDAVLAYRTALHWRPGWPEAARNLVGLLVMQTPLTLSGAAEAIALAEPVCQAPECRDVPLLYTLAVAYQAAGQEARAQDTARQALRVAMTADNPALVAQLQRRFPDIPLTEVADALP